MHYHCMIVVFVRNFYVRQVVLVSQREQRVCGGAVCEDALDDYANSNFIFQIYLAFNENLRFVRIPVLNFIQYIVYAPIPQHL